MRKFHCVQVFCGLIALGVLATALALPAQEKKAAEDCNLVHVPVIKDIQIKYDGTKSIEITATGEVPTTGYKNHVLVRRVYIQAPPDGVWEYDMLTCKPGGIVGQAITPVMAKDKWDDPPRSLKGIRVFGSKEHKEVPIKWPTP
jgi:hypothetical protein